jgi:hypothetical protein
MPSSPIPPGVDTREPIETPCAVTYMTEERDWSRALDDAKSLETLRAVVVGWMPFVPDALAIVNRMDSRAFEKWRDGLAMERKGQFAGVEFQERFGALALPTALIRGSQGADRYKVPLGLYLIRVRDHGKLDELTRSAA